MHKCRFCSGATLRVADFGPMPIANNFVQDRSLDQYRFNLVAAFCENCALFQLENQPAPEKMFHSDYPFFTGLSASMTEHFRLMLQDSLGYLSKNKLESFIVEIGSNDGTLLSNLVMDGIPHLGIDPSANVVEVARSKGVESIVEFFGAETAQKVVKGYGKADLILAANVICHIPDIDDFVRGISILLSDDGRFVFEEPYAGDVLSKTSYDQFYDEHVYIFGCLSVRNIFRKYGLELIDSIHQDTHGGSMRYVIGRKGSHEITSRAIDAINSELALNLDRKDPYLVFGRNCQQRKFELTNLLSQIKSSGKTIAGYAATSKSTTVLNYCNIGPETISFISDSTPEKQGKLTPGTYIPVVTPDEMQARNPDFLVLFAWNHEKEILEKERGLSKSGTKWIRFVPEVEVLEI
jgi:methylation protein EvaC